MDLNRTLIWVVLINSGYLLGILTHQKQLKARTALLPMLWLAVLGCTYLIDPGSAGIVAGSVWLLTAMVPSLGLLTLQWLVFQKQYHAALRVAQCVRVLLPTAAGKVDLLSAVSLMHAGRPEASREKLIRLESKGGALAITARAVRMRHDGQWREVLEWVSHHPQSGRLLNDPLVLDAYLQALGELHDRERLCGQYLQLVAPAGVRLPEVRLPGRNAESATEAASGDAGSDLRATGTGSKPLHLPTTLHQLVQIKIAAFCGDVTRVAQLLAAYRSPWHSDAQRFWMATAMQVAGRTEEAATEFAALADKAPQGAALAERRRIVTPLPSLEQMPLGPQAQRVLHEFAIEMEADRRIQWPFPTRHGLRWAVWLIAAVLLAFFAAEIPGGTENEDNLLQLGAMIVPLPSWENDWWRIITAGLLHFGILHLALNLAGLVIFGRQLERAWGSALTLVCFLLTSIGAIALAPNFMTIPATGAIILVGASGGVMGLVGAMVANAAVQFFVHHSAGARKELTLLVIIVAMQMFFDSQTPNVSSACHILGMLLGLSMGLLLHTIQALRFRKQYRRLHRQSRDVAAFGSNPPVER